MTWREIERDERHRLTFITYRCGGCRKLAVVIGHGSPTKCGCR